ncbi:MAG: hypothetical protein QF903_06725 [Planctomycetota bacterium]|jgi:hypothetical protein|nr:hypothetical protein [Planctomycetota bacterium]MDP6762057.1 hypothetical protein [Planctomycetota bacterium]MDP6989156.1 hypothetical protein [Planctomycetota bacterium]
MLPRILALFQSRLRAHLGGGGPPLGALVAHGALTAGACLILRDQLSPYAYALLTLTLAAGLLCTSLLGEFGSLLRDDPAGEWARSLPATELEQRLARSLAVLVMVALLTAGCVLPALLFSPPSLDLAARASLAAAMLAQALLLSAGLLALQSALGERAEGALVAVQSALVALAAAGTMAALRLGAWLRTLELEGTPWPRWLDAAPPAWFAGWVGVAPDAADLPPTHLVGALAALAVALLCALPAAPAPRGRPTATLAARLLEPLRRAAARFWVRSSERGAFDLVFAGLPLERDFVLRTYPMIGIPLAFLLIGARAESGAEREGLLTLLLFTPAAYLPVLLAQLPATATPRARWLLDCAPIGRAALRGGALKAVAVRFLVPLHALLAALAVALGEGTLAARLAPAGALVSLLALRLLYPRIVSAPPLSTAAEDLAVNHDWMGLVLTLVVVLVLVSVAATALVTTFPRALAFTAALIALEMALDRRRPSPRAAHEKSE